ncbi:MAG: hypothetical protein FWC92_07260 [Defluviitaleaceae bacterium]|nr:hypothetical protein [Defluviitaleaceae bacterium]
MSLLLAVILAGYVILYMQTSRPVRITTSWQTVAIGGLGTFRVPTEWNVEEDERGVLFITDKPMAYGEYEIYIVGAVVGIGFQLHEIFDGVERGDQLRSAMFRNGGGVRVFEYGVNGVLQEHHNITFHNIRERERLDYWMFVWNSEAVDQWHTEQIARTFRSNRDDFNNPNTGRLMP